MIFKKCAERALFPGNRTFRVRIFKVFSFLKASFQFLNVLAFFTETLQKIVREKRGLMAKTLERQSQKVTRIIIHGTILIKCMKDMAFSSG
jgi:hypothetical protein